MRRGFEGWQYQGSALRVPSHLDAGGAAGVGEVPWWKARPTSQQIRYDQIS